jgi:hypothetical protein
MSAASKILVGQEVFVKSDSGFANVLARAYIDNKRPRCLCLAPPIEMYIAKLRGTFVLKRMPNSGPKHAPSCDHYEAPPELSGLGEVMGHAIVENPDDGLTTLKLDFALSKKGGRAPVADTESTQHDSVRTDGNKLSFRGLLHYVWAQAGFDRWAPAMEGKRNWYVLRKYLLEAARDKEAKNAPLSEHLFMPEAFKLDDKDAIEARRLHFFTKAFAGKTATNSKLLILIGEVKELSDARYGKKLIVKHLPALPLMLHADIAKRLGKNFARELELWSFLSSEDVHLVIIATFCMSPTGFATIEQMGLMITNSNWIPIENSYDYELTQKLIAEKRRFIKGLRFNMAVDRPVASALLLDTADQSTALFIESEESDCALLSMAIAESDLAVWRWKPSEQVMPDFPAIASKAGITQM